MHGAMYGTIYAERDGRLARIIDRAGAVHAELVWRPEAGGVDAARGRIDAGDSTAARAAGDSHAPHAPRGATDSADRAAIGSVLHRLVVTGATVDGAVIDHPLLGAAHAVGGADPAAGGTEMSALDWARPTEIPAIAEPARLPPGAGGAILNAIAVLARRAGVTCLRYAGPYPTRALWQTLARSFRTTADEAAFTAGGLDRALRVARDPIAVDFAPAPHERLTIPGGYVELRDGLERAVIGGVAYARDGSPARLVAGDPATTDSTGAILPTGSLGEADLAGSLGPTRDRQASAGDVCCEIWFGDARYARVATLTADGTLRDGPHPIAPCTSPVIGRAFPPALRAAIAELVAETVAVPLADDVRRLVGDQPLVWADLGARAAGEAAGGFVVHAALWDRIAPLGLARLALALAEALAPVVTAAAVRRASRPTAR